MKSFPSGTINFIPKLSYDNTATFNQQFGTYNYGGYDGFGSLGFKYGTMNAGLRREDFLKSMVIRLHQKSTRSIGDYFPI